MLAAALGELGSLEETRANTARVTGRNGVHKVAVSSPSEKAAKV